MRPNLLNRIWVEHRESGPVHDDAGSADNVAALELGCRFVRPFERESVSAVILNYDMSVVEDADGRGRNGPLQPHALARVGRRQRWRLPASSLLKAHICLRA